MPLARQILVSRAASRRVEAGAAWLAGRAAGEAVLVLGASAEATGRVAREAARGVAAHAAFAWHRHTLGRLASQLALPAMVERGVVPAAGLPFEALCARVIHDLAGRGELGRFAAVGSRPRLPRAVARTLGELRLAAIAPETLPEHAADLARIYRAVLDALARERLADRAEVMRLAAEATRAGGGGDLVGLPLLLLDVPAAERVEQDLIAALVARAPSVFPAQWDPKLGIHVT